MFTAGRKDQLHQPFAKLAYAENSVGNGLN